MESFPAISVANMITEEGSQKWNELESVLPDDVLHRLLATPPPTWFGLPDCVGWIHIDKMHFLVQSAYRQWVGTTNEGVDNN
ncbi:hypothetical protein V6N13_104816 [Hibiscus sabdariffa]